jgi:hypothetical protein
MHVSVRRGRAFLVVRKDWSGSTYLQKGIHESTTCMYKAMSCKLANPVYFRHMLVHTCMRPHLHEPHYKGKLQKRSCVVVLGLMAYTLMPRKRTECLDTFKARCQLDHLTMNCSQCIEHRVQMRLLWPSPTSPACNYSPHLRVC